MLCIVHQLCNGLDTIQTISHLFLFLSGGGGFQGQIDPNLTVAELQLGSTQSWPKPPTCPQPLQQHIPSRACEYIYRTQFILLFHIVILHHVVRSSAAVSEVSSSTHFLKVFLGAVFSSLGSKEGVICCKDCKEGHL